MIPKAMVLTLTRAALRPEFSGVSGREDKLSLRARKSCETKVRALGGQEAILGDICSSFSSAEILRHLRNEEVREMKDAVGESFSLIQPPCLAIKSFGFGLTVYRVTATVQPRSEGWSDLLASWRKLAGVMRRVLNERISGAVLRKSLASHCFSEIYTFYELNLSPQDVPLKWKEKLEALFMPDLETRSFLLSPLKISEPPQPQISFIPDPLYTSRDGVLFFLHYSSQGPGKRRNVHQVRRKRRKLLRAAIDYALGLKVYLENEDLWLSGSESPWGALVGMIYLNPKVVSAIHRGIGAKFLRPYSSLLRSLELAEKFEAYESSFWYPFRSEEQALTFSQVVRHLGGKPPGSFPPFPLSMRDFALLRILALKTALDHFIIEWYEGALSCLSKLLCAYADSVLNGNLGNLSDLEEIVKRARAGGPSGGCEEELLSHFRARKGSRRGLTVSELSVLLKHSAKLSEGSAQQAVRSWIRRMDELELLVRAEARRGRGRRAGRRTKRGIPVASFEINLENSLMKQISGIYDKVAERISMVLERECL